MTAKDQRKLLNAGFTIIRPDEHKLIIKAKTARYPDWFVFSGKFDSKKQMKSYIDELLKQDIVVAE